MNIRIYPRRLVYQFLLALILCSISAFAQNGDTSTSTPTKPRIAVYVAGGHDAGVNRALATRLVEAFVNSNQYAAIERSSDFLAEIDREQVMQRSGAVDDEQISRLGKQAGAHFVCVADITRALGSYQVSARIIDVETAAVSAIGVYDSPLQTMRDLTNASSKIVASLLTDAANKASRTAQKRGGKKGEKQQTGSVSAVAEPSPKRERKPIERPSFYIAPRYMFPMTDGVGAWAFDVEGGAVFKNGVFTGIDYGYGGGGSNRTSGFGLNAGYTHGLTPELHLAGGVFAGVWREKWEKKYYDNIGGTDFWVDESHWKNGWVGPFVKVRWRQAELSYKLIIGGSGFTREHQIEETKREKGGGTVSQLMLGVFIKSKV